MTGKNRLLNRKALLFGAPLLISKERTQRVAFSNKEHVTPAGFQARTFQAWLPTRSWLLQGCFCCFRRDTLATSFQIWAFLLFSGCFLPLIITIERCPSFSICGNFPMAIPQPAWVSPERTQHGLFDGSFHCFQGRRFILLELRLRSMCFSFHKVCSCLNRRAGQQLLALSNVTQPGSGIVCQFCTDNE